jgi:hypothetical protein
LDGDAKGGEVKSCLPDWCYAQPCLVGRLYARQIFHNGIDNSLDKGYVDLCLEGEPVV